MSLFTEMFVYGTKLVLLGAVIFAVVFYLIKFLKKMGLIKKWNIKKVR